MATLTSAQFTLRDDTDIVISLEPPEYAIKDMLWLDLSSTPILLKRWGGATGEINGNAINSKSNYSWNNIESATVTVTINNLDKGLGFYNFVGSIGSAKNFIINGKSESLTKFNYPNKSITIQSNESTLILSDGSGDIWCPIGDVYGDIVLSEDFTASIETLQTQIQNIVTNVIKNGNSNITIGENDISFSASDTQVADFTKEKISFSNIKTLELFNYKITDDEKGGIKFDPIVIK